LVNDSIDSFLYQKHDEKGARLNALWSSKDSKLEFGDISPEELKFKLIKDPIKRANLIIKEKTAELKQNQRLAEATSTKLITMARERESYDQHIAGYKEQIEDYHTILKEFSATSDEDIIRSENLDFRYGSDFISLGGISGERGKNVKECRENYVEAVKAEIANIQKAISRTKGKQETIDNTFKKYGVDNPDDKALIEKVCNRYKQEAEIHERDIKVIEANRNNYIAQAEEQIRKDTRHGDPVSVCVERNVKAVSENLCPFWVIKEREERKKNGAAPQGEETLKQKRKKAA